MRLYVLLGFLVLVFLISGAGCEDKVVRIDKVDPTKGIECQEAEREVVRCAEIYQSLSFNTLPGPAKSLNSPSFPLT